MHQIENYSVIFGAGMALAMMPNYDWHSQPARILIGGFAIVGAITWFALFA